MNFEITCRACHGANAEGNKAYFAPRLAGQHASYLARQLTAFRDGLRGSNAADLHGRIMASIARNLSNARIARVVEFIPTLNASRPVATLSGGDATRGQKLYGEVCITCHGSLGQGVRSVSYLKDPAARLAGQHDW